MPRWLKITLWAAAVITVLPVAGWIAIAIYANANRQAIMKQVTAALNDNINGTLALQNMQLELLRGFPGISVSLEGVTLRDSLFRQHGHNLLQAQYVYISVNALSILQHAPRITDIEINNGSIFLFTDSTGYTNASVFQRKKDKDTTAKKIRPHIAHIYIRNVAFTFENDVKCKLFSLDVHRMETGFRYSDTGWQARLKLAALVRHFAFNTGKGSFMQDKELSLNIGVGYNSGKQLISVPNQPFHVGDDWLTLSGTFLLSRLPVTYSLHIAARQILFDHAKQLLTPHIQSKMQIVNLQQPLQIDAQMDGHIKFRDTPRVHVTWLTEKNIMQTPAGEIKDCSFTGGFLNQVDTNGGHGDPNSEINFYNLKGKWTDIPFATDTLHITNLKKPVIAGLFRSRFPLVRLNPVLGGNSFYFSNGNVDLNLLYRGGLMPDDTAAAYIYGTLQVTNAALTYLPRNLSFSNTSVELQFNGNDLFIRNAHVQSGSSKLQMNATLLHFLSLYYNDPSKILIDWQIHSDRINLDDFRSFLAARQPGSPPKAGISKVSRQLDSVLAASTVHLRAQIGDLYYQHFAASDINADVRLAQSGISLNDISVNNAGGTIDINGAIDQQGPVNTFHINAAISGVHIPQFFRGFDNFGQDAITADNLRGDLFATTDVSGSISDSGKILPHSFNGAVHFDVKNGELLHFHPFQTIGKIIFPMRDLDDIKFGELKNTLLLAGDKIFIKPMIIESSALNVAVKGVYALTKGTDINIDVPLRNPKKDDRHVNDGAKRNRDMKGIIVHLKAVDGDNGNVKIKLVTKKEPNPIDTLSATRIR